MDEIDFKYKQYIRLLISYQDFQHAFDIAEIIIEENYEFKRNSTKGLEGQRIKILWEALNSSMILSYCRPFSGNDKNSQSKIPDLTNKVLKTLTNDEKEFHKTLIEDRNTIIAHSDSEAWNIKPILVKTKEMNKPILYPSSNEVRAPLKIEFVEKLKTMCIKLMDETFDRRMELESYLKDKFPTISI